LGPGETAADTSGSQLTYPQLKVLKLLQSSEASNIGDVAAFWA
jgi:hypothetical protein